MTVSRAVTAKVCIRMLLPSKGQFAGRGRGAPEQWLSNGGREHVVEIQMQLAENADPAATFPVDGDHGLQSDLEIASDPDYTGVDGSGRGVGIAEIIGDRRRQTHFDDRNQMIEKIRKI